MVEALTEATPNNVTKARTQIARTLFILVSTLLSWIYVDRLQRLCGVLPSVC